VLDLKPPTSLGARAAYAQAKLLGQKTSRASNKDWYREALDLDYQWHLVVVSGSRVSSVVFHRPTGQWSQGPRIYLSNPPTKTMVEAAVEEILAQGSGMPKPRSIGVVIHMGDELATTEVLAECRTPEQIAAMGRELIFSPATALGDPSINPETTSTRLLPYAGAQEAPHATSITLSHAHTQFISTLREVSEERNLPIRTCTLSAPLAFLSILPAFLSHEDPRPRFILLHYLKFSALAVLDAPGNLLQFRALPHRGRLHPSNLGDAINTAIDALDLRAPAVYIFPMSEVDPSPLLTQLQTTLTRPEETEMQILRPALDGIAPEAPDLRPEMLVAVRDYDSSSISVGYAQLYGQRWALQDFLPIPVEQQALYPSQGEMSLLRAARLLMPLLAFGIIALLAMNLFRVVSVVGDPAWQHDPEDNARAQQELTELQRQLTSYNHWNNLLQGRSQGWLAMEVLSRLFPEESGVRVSDFNYSAKLENTRKADRTGILREWDIRGHADEDALPLLSRLGSREGMAEIFNQLAAATGNGSFNTTSTGRNLIVSLQREANPGYIDGSRLDRNDPATFRYTFSLKITQSFPSEDPMGISSKSLSLFNP